MNTWIKLKSNKAAMVGLVIILIAVLISILGANIRPDATVNANYQIQQISRLNPGAQVKLLKIRRNETVKILFCLVVFIFLV